MIGLKDFLEEQFQTFVSIENLKIYYKTSLLRTEKTFSKIKEAQNTLDLISNKISNYESLNTSEISLVYNRIVLRNNALFKYEREIAKKVEEFGYIIEYLDENFVSKILEDVKTPTFVNCIVLQSRLETYIENLTQIHSFFKRLPNEYHKEKEGVKNHLDAAHSLMERSTFILSKCNFSSENFKNPKINQLFLNETKIIH